MNLVRDAAYRVQVLSVSPSKAITRRLRISSGIRHGVSTVPEASGGNGEISRSAFPVILCEETLPDGNWKDLFACVNACRILPT